MSRSSSGIVLILAFQQDEINDQAYYRSTSLQWKQFLIVFHFYKIILWTKTEVFEDLSQNGWKVLLKISHCAKSTISLWLLNRHKDFHSLLTLSMAPFCTESWRIVQLCINVLNK